MKERLLDGEVAIVTGGGRGIGRAIVKRFAQEGARVAIAQRDAASGEATRQEIEAAGGEALFVPTDVANRAMVEHMVEETVSRFGTIGILVNNAAYTGANGPFLELEQDIWDRVIGASLTGVFICSQLAARVMAQKGGGNIIHISSINAFRPAPRCAAYVAAKGALEALTRSMAVDLAAYHIRVNCIWPGPIQSHGPDDMPPRPSQAALLGRVGHPSEVAAAAVFLASEESSFITGQSIGVDGGVIINRQYWERRPQADITQESKTKGEKI